MAHQRPHRRTNFALFSVLLYSFTSTSFVHAQVVNVPDPGTFEHFLKSRLPDLSPSSIVLEPNSTPTRRDIDRITGLVPPKSPFGALEKLPDNDPRVRQYEKALEDFLQRRQQVIQLHREYERTLNERKRLQLLNFALPAPPSYFAGKVSKWNGPIFWAPASKTTDINLQFGDEARAVFGPIPPFDLTTLGTVTANGWTIQTGVLVGEVEGNQIELKPNDSKPGSPLEFQHRDINGNIVKWTTTIDQCDKPSLAGGVTPCGTSSRISRAVKGNVEWISLARKTTKVEKLGADPYWMPGNPNYLLVGYIGFNRVSGEVVFFDGTYQGMKFNWSAAIVPPGGAGYNDDVGRSAAAQTYDATFRIECVACHDNKKPRIITPYIKQARVGYENAERATAFSLGALLPYLPRAATAPYRVIGTSYTAVHAQAIAGGRTVADPGQNCNVCHGLTNSGAGRFASDAVGKLGTLTGDPGVENSYRTTWALRTGAGKIHPWMVPGSGNDISSAPPVLSDSDWSSLRAVIENPPADSLQVYTTAPAPESVITDSTRIADPAAPTNFAVTVADNRDGSSETMPKEVHLTWNYSNRLGGIPERDDVRFNVAIVEKDIPSGGAAPALSEYPTIDQAKGTGATDLGGGVYSDQGIFILENSSFTGHQQFTDPASTTSPRQYRVDFPASKNKRYLIRVLAKRFSFDQSGEVYSNADHVLSVDVQ